MSSCKLPDCVKDENFPYAVVTETASAGRTLDTAGAQGKAAGHQHAAHTWRRPAAL